MHSKGFQYAACVCVAALIEASLPVPLAAEPAVTGSIAGEISDRETGKPLPGVTIRAHAATANQHLAAVGTDRQGRFQITNAPASVYAFTLSYQGVDYPVVERLDVRVGMSFLLESCFEIDRAKASASLKRENCDPGIVEEAKVVTLSPHRFLRTSVEGLPSSDASSDAAGTAAPPEIVHDPLLCLPVNQFPLVRADIRPGREVKVARVYFRSAKFPEFYYVEMKPTDKNFEAILPKPLPETERVIYYIEALNQSLNNARTEDYGPQVSEEEKCKRRGPGAVFPGNSPNIIVGATQAGAAAVPPGFYATGIAGFLSSTGALSGGASGRPVWCSSSAEPRLPPRASPWAEPTRMRRAHQRRRSEKLPLHSFRPLTEPPS